MKKIITIILAILFTANLMAQVPNYVPTNGLVGWWPFNGNANDESGNGNNGTVNGATLITDRFGNANKAYQFGGNANSFIEVPNSSSINITGNQLTISAWISSKNLPSDNKHKGISKGGWGSGEGYELLYRNTNVGDSGAVQLGGSYGGLQAWVNINGFDSNWFHLIGVFNNGSGHFYVNGKIVYAGFNGQQFNNFTSSNYPLLFGKTTISNSPLSGFVNGKLDDIGIWNRALNQDEITALYSGCVNNLLVTPVNNNKTIGTNAIFTASVSDPNPSYIWQIDFGQGFQTLNSVGKYSGTSTNTMSISNVQLSNHMEPIRAISVSGNCRDTSNIAYVKITDTCITKINDTIKINKYDTIKVMDTLVINATLSGVSAPNNTNRLIVYPNPAKDHITIDYGVFSRMSGYTLKIVNTLGQTVFSSPINQQSSYINLSTWTGKGMYNVQIFDTQNNLIENRKIVLQ
jgi:hypothetical protein